jgi:hypothetical protein
VVSSHARGDLGRRAIVVTAPGNPRFRASPACAARADLRFRRRVSKRTASGLENPR